MKKNKTILLNVFMLIFFSILVCKIGFHQHNNYVNGQQSLFKETDFSFWNIIISNMNGPSAILLLQISIIILTARIFGWLFKHIGQPSVIGEIVAGIFLGPSFLSLLFPQLGDFLFPKTSLVNLQFISNLGLIFFMFIIGMELEIKAILKNGYNALFISNCSILIPFLSGIGLSYFYYDDFVSKNISFVSFTLFMGISLCVTAFPVLARILNEKGLTKTPVGLLSITIAAMSDISAWFILAVVIAIVKSQSAFNIVYTIGFSLLYILIMFIVIKPLMQKLGELYHNQISKRKYVVAIVFMTLLISSYITEIIGIHAIFGAFLTGVIMPTDFEVRRHFSDKIEDLSIVLMLPIFFALNGLRTQISLLSGTKMWTAFIVITVVAILSKFISSAVASKLTGQNLKNALTIGALMNTRGMMELIVLNIGYDLGILPPSIFTIMVLMAIFTTLITSPVITLINKIYRSDI